MPTKFKALFVDRVKVSRLIEVLEVKLKSDVKIKSLPSNFRQPIEVAFRANIVTILPNIGHQISTPDTASQPRET